MVGPGATMVVSVGVGCVVLPVRTFADPEVISCTLYREDPHR
jgi:predicted MPP superfamily phosphohydrolase